MREGWKKIARSYLQGKYPNYTESLGTVGPKNWKSISKIRNAVDIRIKKADTETMQLFLDDAQEKECTVK